MSRPPGRAVVVMGKVPTSGTVKTRLVPPLNPQQAARLYGAFLHDTLVTALAVPAAHVILFHPPDDDQAALHDIVPVGVACVEDTGTNLGDSMQQAFRHCFNHSATSVVLIGSDLPTLPTQIVETAFTHLDDSANDVVLGPSLDGGYYLIGLRTDQPALFEGMVWSTSRVLEQTLDRARRAGLHTALLEPWRDIDRPSDLEALVEELAHNPRLTAPATRRVLAAIWPAVASNARSQLTPPAVRPKSLRIHYASWGALQTALLCLHTVKPPDCGIAERLRRMPDA